MAISQKEILDRFISAQNNHNEIFYDLCVNNVNELVAFPCFTAWQIKVHLRCKWGTKQWIKSTWETFLPPHVGL